MAAKTLAAIKTLVEGNTGRAKDTLEGTAANDALKIALLEHPFRDAQSEPTDIAITEDAIYSTIATASVIDIITARIVEVSGSRNQILKLKTRNWWDEYVINPEDNNKGWPEFGLRVASTIVYDRPAESGLALRLRVTSEQAFATDATVCPIYVLDTFIVEYVTAQIFRSIEQWDSYQAWIASACGGSWLRDGKVGGSLLKAIQNDSMGDTALDIKIEPEGGSRSGGGVSVLNAITGHDDDGNTRWWN